MSEYIITCDDEVAMWIGNDVETMERIVRCRDCEYRNPNASEAIWEKDGKLIHGFPEKSAYLCHLINRCVDLSGFCKWGARKKKDE